MHMCRLLALSENLGQTYTSSTKNEILIIATKSSRIQTIRSLLRSDGIRQIIALSPMLSWSLGKQPSFIEGPT